MDNRKNKRASLSPLESAVMRVVWQRGEVRADDVRQALAARRPLKESTVRTLLSRMEAKGFVQHRTEGRTYVYRPRVQPQDLAVDELRGIVERFGSGAVPSLVLGMASERLISPTELRQLADQIERAEAAQAGRELDVCRKAKRRRSKRRG